MSRITRCARRSDVASAVVGDRRQRRRSSDGSHVERNAYVSEPHTGQRSSTWRFSQSRHKRATRSCINRAAASRARDRCNHDIGRQIDAQHPRNMSVDYRSVSRAVGGRRKSALMQPIVVELVERGQAVEVPDVAVLLDVPCVGRRVHVRETRCAMVALAPVRGFLERDAQFDV